MIKEAKNIDFYTTGRQPSEQDFARISEWIRTDKEKHNLHKRKTLRKKSTPPNKSILAASGAARS